MTWHEDGAAELAAALLDRGIGVADVLVLPDGTAPEGNADLVRAPRQLGS